MKNVVYVQNKMESSINTLQSMMAKYPKMEVKYKNKEGVVGAFIKTLQTAQGVPRGLLRMQQHLRSTCKVELVDARIISQCALHVYTMMEAQKHMQAAQRDTKGDEVDDQTDDTSAPTSNMVSNEDDTPINNMVLNGAIHVEPSISTVENDDGNCSGSEPDFHGLRVGNDTESLL